MDLMADLLGRSEPVCSIILVPLHQETDSPAATINE